MFLRSVALLVFFSTAAGAGVVAADLVVAVLNSLRRDWFFSAIEDEWEKIQEVPRGIERLG